MPRADFISCARQAYEQAGPGVVARLLEEAEPRVSWRRSTNASSPPG